MTFTVKYRTSNGSTAEKAVEAANRADCFAKCKERGISPMSVKDGKPEIKSARVRISLFHPLKLIWIAIGLLIAGVGLWFWTIAGKPKAQIAVAKTPKVKNQVEAVKPVTNMPVKAEAPKPQKREIPPPGTRRHITSWKKPPGYDQMSPAQKTLAQPIGRVIKRPGYGKKRLFTEHSDIKIERLLRLKPGQMFLGTLKYDEKFVKDFIKSLDTPIVIDEKDSPEDKEMKQAMIDTRADLKAAYDRGEDIAAIMTETERQMREMATYRMDLERMASQQFRENPDMSAQDMADFVEAANTMLKERGMEPLKTGAFWYHRAKMQESRRQAEQKK